MLIPLSLIGFLPDAQAQTITANVTGDPFTIGEGSKTLSVYFSTNNFVDTDNSILSRLLVGHVNYNVDSSERLIFNRTTSTVMQYAFIPLDTTIGELQQTINLGGNFYSTFNYSFTGLVTQNGTTNIYLAVFDDDVVTSNRIGAGTAVPLIENGNPQERNILFFRSNLGSATANIDIPILFNTNNANKTIGYIIEFNNPVTVEAGSYPISLDFSSFRLDDTPINHITRQSVELTPEQRTTYQNLVNAIAARNLAIDQQNVIVDYWTNSNNPFADDRELAQARIDHANSHITQSTIQRDSYQTQLDQLTS